MYLRYEHCTVSGSLLFLFAVHTRFIGNKIVSSFLIKNQRVFVSFANFSRARFRFGNTIVIIFIFIALERTYRRLNGRILANVKDFPCDQILSKNICRITIKCKNVWIYWGYASPSLPRPFWQSKTIQNPFIIQVGEYFPVLKDFMKDFNITPKDSIIDPKTGSVQFWWFIFS